MKILFITNYYPLFHDLDSGAANRSTMFVTALASFSQVDIISFAGEVRPNIPNCRVVFQQSFCRESLSESFSQKVKRLLPPWDVYKFYQYNPEKEAIVDRQILSSHYDFIAVRYLEEVSCFHLMKYASKLIVDIDDNPSQAILVEKKKAKTIRNKVYHFLLAHAASIMAEATCNKVFLSFYSNINQRPSNKSFYLHNVPVIEAGENYTPACSNKQILFVGSMSYYPNMQGLKILVDHIFPIIKEKEPSTILHVCGRFNNDVERVKISGRDGVSILGFVSDLKNEYRESKVVVVPCYSGSGTSVKTIEAMFMQRPCVTTKCGVRGFPELFIEGVDYLLGETYEQFADNVIRLLNDPQTSSSIAKSAFTKASSVFSKEKFVKIVKQSVLCEQHISAI